jgi:hypothetical protein
MIISDGFLLRFLLPIFSSSPRHMHYHIILAILSIVSRSVSGSGAAVAAHIIPRAISRTHQTKFRGPAMTAPEQPRKPSEPLTAEFIKLYSALPRS